MGKLSDEDVYYNRRMRGTPTLGFVNKWAAITCAVSFSIGAVLFVIGKRMNIASLLPESEFMNERVETFRKQFESRSIMHEVIKEDFETLQEKVLEKEKLEKREIKVLEFKENLNKEK